LYAVDGIVVSKVHDRRLGQSSAVKIPENNDPQERVLRVLSRAKKFSFVAAVSDTGWSRVPFKPLAIIRDRHSKEG